MDTLKHVSFEEARSFCGTIKEFTANLGKHDFFLVGEIAGGDFAEDRYLHQTGRFQRDGQFVLAEDLPELLRQITDQAAAGANQRLAPPRLDVDDRSWCIHFHVPIFLQHFGNLTATQPEIDEALGTLLSLDSEAYVPHLEIETYAWSVLPPELQSNGLVPSISREVHWLDERLTTLGQAPAQGDT
jgi:hypothetical protein